MNPAIQDGRSTASLTAKIADTERSILEQRADVRLRAATLARSIRHQLTSPTMLLLAAGSGFIAGKILLRPAATHPQSGDEIKRPSAPGLRFLETVLKAGTLIRGILSLLPGAVTGSDSRTATPPSQHARSTV